MSSDQHRLRPDIPALIGSRICHDLISPIGAIGNGVELLAMSGGGIGPEMSLISESVSSANARIRFYRIAYGQSGRDQRTSRAEILSILSDLYAGTRLEISWKVTADCPRSEAKAALLALQCLETSMPYGGKVEITRTGGAFRISGKATKLRADDSVWQILQDPDTGPEVTAAMVHFALLPAAVEKMGRALKVERGEGTIVLSF